MTDKRKSKFVSNKLPVFNSFAAKASMEVRKRLPVHPVSYICDECVGYVTTSFAKKEIQKEVAPLL